MNDLKDKLPFHCIITGPTNCGKTEYLIGQLRGEYRFAFNYIVLICPTYEKNKTYKNFANGDPRFIVIPEDEINNILEDVETVFGSPDVSSRRREVVDDIKTLVIIDDCAFTKDIKQRSNKFISLAFSGRHQNISLWVLTQQLTAIAKPFRENVACIISFFTPNRVANQTLFDEFGGDLSAEHKKEFMKILKSEKYSRICFCLRHPSSSSSTVMLKYLIYMESILEQFDEQPVFSSAGTEDAKKSRKK